jgi:hypothetical protein
MMDEEDEDQELAGPRQRIQSEAGHRKFPATG